MDSKQAKEIPITKKPYRYHFYNSIKRHPFTLGPLYLATVLGIAYGVSTMYTNYNIPKVRKIRHQNKSNTIQSKDYTKSEGSNWSPKSFSIEEIQEKHKFTPQKREP